jgi:hypothetical protein
MRGYRFYEELAYKGRTNEASVGNVVAVDYENGMRFERGGDDHDHTVYEAVGSVFSHPNSPCASTSVSTEYLAQDCKRISEARAREIHPQLFRYLEGSELVAQEG